MQKNSDLSIAVTCKDADIRNVRALLVGPPETPYEFGFFEFALRFPADYPTVAPVVQATTTNGGRCRFNPNIYSSGRVCLSILGTWKGERGEDWSSVQGLESILLSIQSLMSANPYENEPGFEEVKTPDDKRWMKEYADKIRHESLRISVIQRLEEYMNISTGSQLSSKPKKSKVGAAAADDADSDDGEAGPWEPFKDMIKRRFLWYYESYKLSIAKAQQDHVEGEVFRSMPFESTGNNMEGRYMYSQLLQRLERIKAAIDDEAGLWVEQGLLALKQQTGRAANLKRQYEQAVEAFKRNTLVSLDIELVNGNPFEWAITYFGRPMTNLDGGLFRIKLYISTKPEEHLRAKFETPLFHHRIAVDGTPCYTTSKPDDVKSHIDAIIEALEEEHPPYDPRTLVNSEAAKLFWGSPDDKKAYNRQLRRAVQRSTE